ncbi:MAG: hypothetical protein K0R76_550 [Alphaproteobacteria bacterium]|jgi:predicted nuclease of restriction endonuclease-like (RecB) superfamily|nr:hypothetical protein [Alphaproteobacteria bacterium]
MTNLINNQEYLNVLNTLKAEIKNAQLRAHLSVNRELVILYWRIGREILQRKKELGWGSKIIDKLSQDLHHEFPEMKGLSSRNLIYMQTFAAAYPDYEFTQAVPAQITWYHNQTLLDKVSDPEMRVWYMHKAIEQGWSRNVMVMHIESNLYERQGKSLTNFKQTLRHRFINFDPQGQAPELSSWGLGNLSEALQALGFLRTRDPCIHLKKYIDPGS